ncbi:MAG: cell surface protein SprA [Fibrobacterota bacterium]
MLATKDTSIYPVSLNHPDAAFLAFKSEHFKKQVFINFQKKEVEVVLYYRDAVTTGVAATEDSLLSGVVLGSSVFLEFDEYLDFMNARQFDDDWKQGNPFFNMTEQKRKAFNPLDIEIPVKLPAWARRVVGSEGPRLTINGMFKITVGGASHWTKNGQNIDNQNAGFPDIAVNQEMNFTVTGKIGRLINVSISTDNTQEITDQLKKQMKIHYKGETEDELEDEIVQEVEAGYTSFAMPGSEFDGYSENHEGLFGIKARLKLGDLNVTAIVSQEDGQADKKTFNPTQNEEKSTLQDRDILFDKVFFLDTMYYNAYYSTRAAPPIIKKVVLLKLTTQPSANDFDRNPSQYTDHRKLGIGVHKILREVGDEKGESEFYVDRTRGIVVLKNNLMNKEDQLLAYFITEDGRTSNRDFNLQYIYSDSVVRTSVDGDSVYPYILRPVSPKLEDTLTWKLSWKNVYDLGNISQENRNSVKISVKRQDPVNPQQWYETVPIKNVNGVFKDSLLSDYFGLTENGAMPKNINTLIYMFDFGALALPAAFGPEPFNSPLFPDTLKKNPLLYQCLREDQTAKQVPNYYTIEITAKASRSTFSLGVINILEGSEKVRNGASDLVRDVDYVIQYDIGQISLISETAINSMSNITVEFEYAPFFIPEQKTFMGLRAEYKLPFIGKESYIAASFLRKSETSQDKRSQLGREPTTNMLVDVNGKLNWEPGWMTDVVNKIPGVRTDQKSNLSFSAEFAHSIVNPNTNTRNEALLDDFEDSKTLYTLQISDALWHWASPPVPLIIDSAAGMQCWGGNDRGPGSALSDVGWFAWYTRDTTEASIWGRNSANPQSRWRILELNMNPHSRKAGQEGQGTAADWFKKASWGGCMAPLGFGVKSQLENAQFLEMWVYVDADDRAQKGFMHVDLGEISEDLRIAPQNPLSTDSNSIMLTNARPDGQFESEFNLTLYKEMTPKNDMGLDLRDNAYERVLIPVDTTTVGNGPRPFAYNFDNFDTLGSGDVADPAGDDFYWTVDSRDFRSFNGTQSNSTGESFDTRKQNDPDDEDVFTSNTIVDRSNAYFHYWIDLNKISKVDEPYLASITETGWRLYRIPLLQKKVTGDPALDSIPYKIGLPLLANARGVRVWIDSLTASARVQIAKMEIVGNKWTSRDSSFKVVDTTVVPRDTTVYPNLMNVSVVNTVDNPDIYTHPSFVPNYYDRDRNVDVREQSLLMAYDSLRSGSPPLQAVKFYQRGLDLRLYKKLMFYYQTYEKNRERGNDPADNVIFFFRFGTDTANYYETHFFPRPAGQGWDSVTLNLNDLALLKQREIERMGRTNGKLYAEEGALAVRGYPTFADIKWLSFGFVVDTSRVSKLSNDIFSGKMFVNDLKLTEPQALSGNAARVKLDGAFADLLTVSTGAYYKDGTFLKLTEKQDGGGQSEVAMDVNSTLNLNKFTPARWGLSLPLSASLKTSIQRPRYVPGADLRLSDDGLSAMAPALLNLATGADLVNADNTLAKRYESNSAFKSLSTSYKKNSASDNLLVNLLADRLTTAGGVSQSNELTITQKSATLSVNNNLAYNANAKSDLSVKPFERTDRPLLKEHFSDLKFTYYPQSLNFKLYDARYSRADKWSRPSLDAVPVPLASNYTFSMSHSYDMTFPLLNWRHLSLGYNHSNSVDRNFNDAVTRNQGVNMDVIQRHVLEYDSSWTLRNGLLPEHFILSGETGNNQSFSYNAEPSLVKWLTHTFDYRATYAHNLNSALNSQKAQTNYLNTTSSTAFSANVNWMFVDMLEGFGGADPAAKAGGVRKSVVDAFKYLGLSKVGANYDVSVGRRVSNLAEMPLTPGQYLTYRMGFFGQTPLSIVTGREDAKQFGGWKYSGTPDAAGVFAPGLGLSTTDGRDVNISTGTNLSMTLPFLLNTSLSSSVKYARSYKESAGRASVDTSITWPSFGVSGSFGNFMTLAKQIPVLGSRLNGSSASSTFNYEKQTDIRFKSDDANVRWENTLFKYGLSPLLKLTFDFRNRVQFNNDVTWSLDRSLSTEPNIKSLGKEEYRLSDKAGLSYTLAKNKTFKFLFWEMVFNNALSISASYEFTKNWKYEWDTFVNGRLNRTYNDFIGNGTPQAKEKSKTYGVTGGASYDITAKMKAGADMGWKKSVRVLPGNAEDSSDNPTEYNINVGVWVQWNF